MPRGQQREKLLYGVLPETAEPGVQVWDGYAREVRRQPAYEGFGRPPEPRQGPRLASPGAYDQVIVSQAGEQTRHLVVGVGAIAIGGYDDFPLGQPYPGLTGCSPAHVPRMADEPGPGVPPDDFGGAIVGAVVHHQHFIVQGCFVHGRKDRLQVMANRRFFVERRDHHRHLPQAPGWDIMLVEDLSACLYHQCTCSLWDEGATSDA